MSRVRVVVALARAGFQTATSYRARFLFSLASVAVTTLPLFFIARALQPMMSKSIATEGGDYFAFLLIGFVVLGLIQSASEALPAQVAGDIGNGFLEAMLASPSGAPTILLGLPSYAVLFAILRGGLMLGLGVLLGIHVQLAKLPEAGLIVLLLCLAHFGVGLLATAAVVLFRTTFSLPQIFSTASALLGGAYWPTSVIPSWLHQVSEVFPLTYGLRALRRIFLEGVPLNEVSSDVFRLASSAGLLLTTGVMAVMWALQKARAHGTLSQY